jgi:hypothetical protein
MIGGRRKKVEHEFVGEGKGELRFKSLTAHDRINPL